ncbi:MarR family transcriptional regulator [Streptomyces longwoodensis]|uniref:MarR family transcriptional regulator n=1 Tax=Streptomyces lasalocidi TaxID=324833 RepID=A0A4U5WI07_STRLS|nr:MULTISPECIES: MarR family transcriptional regulator [Streptomyces]MCX4994657.1 MarR family transcriptional regulator [Streptomyces longwoodensis]TKT01625.1 MarR family transcriptional regulator [Streptomyces lasalocidi]WRY89476.1 MarR family transcriptional regulator [Streptomyces longwoodensis]WTI46245.1 MarR family transcriptional regulator [Streptomyces longwoodensis]WUC59033.1 MarR family transcriptional regulator [Streptomyces longwoodensis]
MAGEARYEELMRQFSAFGAVKRELGRILPSDCPSGSTAVLTLLGRHGDMRMSKLAELLVVDMSVTSRHVAHLAERGWIERSPDPADKRSRIVRLTPAGWSQIDELSRRTTRLLEERLGDWTDDEVDQLTRLMQRLRSSFDDCRTTAHRPPQPPAGPPAPPPAPPALDQTTRTPANT